MNSRYNMFTKAQWTMIQQMMVLIALQWALLLGVVFALHTYAPRRFFMFFPSVLIDILLYLFLAWSCIWVIYSVSTLSPMVRLSAFFILGVLLALVLGVQYNQMVAYSNHPEWIQQSFWTANQVTAIYFLVVLVSTPWLLRYANLLVVLASHVFFGFLIFFITSFFVPYRSRAWIWFLYAFLSMFLLFLITDTVMVVHRCRRTTPGSCDPIQGATMLYVDLVNILQKLWMILADQRR